MVYLGTDPLTRRQQYLKSGAVDTEDLSLIELGKLLERAAEGQAPDSDAALGRHEDWEEPRGGVASPHPADPTFTS